MHTVFQLFFVFGSACDPVNEENPQQTFWGVVVVRDSASERSVEPVCHAILGSADCHIWHETIFSITLTCDKTITFSPVKSKPTTPNGSVPKIINTLLHKICSL